MSTDQWKRVTPPPPGLRRSLTYNDHPLRLLFRARRFTTREGMNWLQERGHISDLCLEPEDVARVDAERILHLAGAQWALPAFDNLMPRELILGARIL